MEIRISVPKLSPLAYEIVSNFEEMWDHGAYSSILYIC